MVGVTSPQSQMDIIQISDCEEIDIRVNQLYVGYDILLPFQPRIYHLFDEDLKEDMTTTELISA
jgi:hypothetical protein